MREYAARLPGGRRGHLPPHRRRPRDRRCAPAPSPRSATATCTPSRFPTSAAWPCSVASPRRTSSGGSCRSSPGSGPFVFRDAGIVLIAGAMICAVGVLDDLFELDALSKLGGQVLAAGFLIVSGIQFVFFPQPDGSQFVARPGPGRAAHGGRGGRDRQRGELRRRTRRARGRRGRHRRGRVLPVQLPAGQPQPGHPGHHRRLPQRRAGGRVRGVPAAQLPPGPALHGRQRLDADRVGAVRQRAHAHHPVLRQRDQPGRVGLRGEPAADPAPARCCRSRS